MITYQQAQKEHLPQMTALWCSVYGDRREYTEAFYAHWFGKCICMTALDGTHVAGILHLLPAVLQRNGRIDAAYYLYAGAVEPAYRCRGIYANLLRMICKRSAEEQRTVLGIPAEASLFPYYARFGFRPLPVYSTETVRKRGEAPQERPVMTELTAEQYARMAAGLPSAMLWDKDGLEYAFFEIRECGGFAKRFMLRGAECAALGSCADNTLYLRSLIAPESLRDAAMQALLHSFRCETLICRIPPDADSAQEKGMICGQHAADTGSVFIPLDLL